MAPANKTSMIFIVKALRCNNEFFIALLLQLKFVGVSLEDQSTGSLLTLDIFKGLTVDSSGLRYLNFPFHKCFNHEKSIVLRNPIVREVIHDQNFPIIKNNKTALIIASGGVTFQR
jgi:hypothetical protein